MVHADLGVEECCLQGNTCAFTMYKLPWTPGYVGSDCMARAMLDLEETLIVTRFTLFKRQHLKLDLRVVHESLLLLVPGSPFLSWSSHGR